MKLTRQRRKQNKKQYPYKAQSGCSPGRTDQPAPTVTSTRPTAIINAGRSTQNDVLGLRKIMCELSLYLALVHAFFCLAAN